MEEQIQAAEANWVDYKFFGRWKWQDALFSIGEIVFILGLIPSVLGDEKPEPLTSVTTAFMLSCFLLIHYSYKLWTTFALTLITIGLWFTLFVQAA